MLAFFQGCLGGAEYLHLIPQLSETHRLGMGKRGNEAAGDGQKGQEIDRPEGEALPKDDTTSNQSIAVSTSGPPPPKKKVALISDHD